MATSRFLRIYKYYLLVFFVLFLIAFLTGIFTCASYSSDLECSRLINSYLLNFLTGDISLFSYFLTMSIYFLIISLFTILFCKNRIMIIINAILLVLLGYILGFDITIVIVCLGLSGIIFGVLILGLFNILAFMIYIAIMSVNAQRYVTKCSTSTYEEKQYKGIYSALIILAVVLLFLMSLLFSIIHIFVIVD